MKKQLLVIACIIATLAAEAQDKYWIQFTDKGNTSYSFSNPSAFLSTRAIQRRTTQNIALDSTDIPVNAAYYNAVAATGVQMLGKSKWLNGVIISTNNPAALATINAFPFVNGSVDVGIRPYNGTVKKWEPLPGDENASARSGSMDVQSLNYGQSFNQINMLGGVCLHNQGFTGAGMMIAVIDAGFTDADTMVAFDTLRAHNRILGTYDFVLNQVNAYGHSSHGTMVLSCMGGNLPGQLVGTAPDASYWLLRSEAAATEFLIEEYFWASAAEFADSVGCDIINSSLGYNQFDDPAQNHVFATDMDGDHCPSSIAADYAAAKGMAVVVSAGNSGQSPWRMIGAPADADSVLTIGAVDAGENIAGFSSHGFSADGDVKPNVCAQGVASVVAVPGGGVITGNGTSFASPITAGLVACLWQAHPNVNNMTLLSFIEQSADRFSSPDTLYGHGVPDFCTATLTLGGLPGTNYTAENALLEFGPNPFTETISFSYFSAIDQQVTVELFDVRGRMLMQENLQAKENSLNKFTIRELTALEKGIYFVRIADKSNRFTEKVIKQ